MADDDEARPIVIKKKKKGGHGAHHGGAWKVAYADFVTAMMAFFLLLWLLNATTEEQKEGIADYFSPTTVSDSTSGGGGVLGGQTLSSEGALVNDRAPIGMNMRLPSPDAPVSDERVKELAEDMRKRERARFEQVREKLTSTVQAIPELSELKENVLVDITPEGLRIQLVDARDTSMFELGSPKPKPRTRDLLGLVAQAVADLPNKVSVKGHTDATPYAGDGDYGNWELSADRANASRRTLVQAGLPEPRIGRVVGRADQDLLVPEDPGNPRNRRISIVLLNQDHETAARRAVRQGDGAREARDAPERRGGPSILRDEPDAG